MSVLQFQTRARRNESKAVEAVIAAKLNLQLAWEREIDGGYVAQEDIAQAVADADSVAQDIIDAYATGDDSVIAPEDVVQACERLRALLSGGTI